MTPVRTTIWVDNQTLTAAALNGEFNNLLKEDDAVPIPGSPTSTAAAPTTPAFRVGDKVFYSSKPEFGSYEISAVYPNGAITINATQC